MGKPLNIDAIIEGVQKALEAVQTIAPIAQKFGIVAPVATIAISAAGVINNILERVQEGKEVLAERDEGKLKAILADIGAVNDRLNQAIKDS